MSIKTFEISLEASQNPAIMYSAGEVIHAPYEAFLFDASYSRDGQNLILSDDLGTEIIVRDFFAHSDLPRLVNQWGAGLDGELVAKLAGPGLIAQNTNTASDLGEPVGTVQDLAGKATVQHANGISEPIKAGQPIYADDVIQTGPGGTVGVIFSDNTVLSIGTNSRMVVDEFAYDPSNNDGNMGVSFLKGAFSFVSGKIAKNDYNDVVLKVPFGAIGIRGTEFVVDIDTNGVTTISVLEGSVATIAEDAEVLLQMGQFVTFGPTGFSVVDQLGAEIIRSQYPTLFQSQRRTIEKREDLQEEKEEKDVKEESSLFLLNKALEEGEEEGLDALDRAFEDDFLDVVEDGDFKLNRPREVDFENLITILSPPEDPLKPLKKHDTDAPIINQMLYGTSGDDMLVGGLGNDFLKGFDGQDTLYGGGGDDIITGGLGIDIMNGGPGSDIFNFNSFSEVYVHSTDSITSPGFADQITDFTSGVDTIRLDSTSFSFSGSYNPGTDFINLGATAYDGTNAGVITTGTIIFGDNKLYYEANSSAPGYVVIAETPGSTVAATDITVVSPP